MASYYVQWSIDVDASTPEEAARVAREIQQQPDSIATVFGVTDWESVRVDAIQIQERLIRVDLDEIGNGE